MDQGPNLELSKERVAAGAEYLIALKTLGIVPDCLLWARDIEHAEWILILATRYFDAVGPLQISETLFRAYNASATPSQIDPFIIQLHSPRQRIIAELQKVQESYRTNPDSPDHYRITSLAGLTVHASGIYRVHEPKALNDNLAKKWAAIAHRINRLAA